MLWLNVNRSNDVINNFTALSKCMPTHACVDCFGIFHSLLLCAACTHTYEPFQPNFIDGSIFTWISWTQINNIFIQYTNTNKQTNKYTLRSCGMIACWTIHRIRYDSIWYMHSTHCVCMNISIISHPAHSHNLHANHNGYTISCSKYRHVK